MTPNPAVHPAPSDRWTPRDRAARIASIASILFATLTWSQEAAAVCATDFLAFVKQFEGSRAFQRQHTRFPLSASRIDNKGVEGPHEVAYSIRNHADPNYKRVAWPTRSVQTSLPFERRIEQGPGGVQTVTFTKPGTDFTVTFYFERSRECWTLVKFSDFSL